MSRRDPKDLARDPLTALAAMAGAALLALTLGASDGAGDAADPTPGAVAPGMSARPPAATPLVELPRKADLEALARSAGECAVSGAGEAADRLPFTFLVRGA